MTLSLATHAPASVPSQGKGVLYGLAAVAMWAGYLAFARAGVKAGLLPQDFILLRYGVAGLALLPWLLRHDPARLAGVGWRRGLALALFAGPVFIALGVAGYRYAPLSHGAVMQPAALTLGSMAAGWLLFGERPGAARIAGIAIILGGLALIAGGAGSSAEHADGVWRGDLLFIAAGSFWVAFTMLLRRWGVGALPATAAVAVVSAAVVIPAFLIWADPARLLALPPKMLVGQILVQGLGAGLFAVFSYGRAVEILGAGRAVLFPALVPAATLLLGLPVAGELPSVTELSGALATTLGLAVAMGALRIRPLAR